MLFAIMFVVNSQLETGVQNRQVFYQGSWHSYSDQALGFLNEGLFFGESPFSSFRSSGGRVLFLDDHLDRLQKSLSFLYEIEAEPYIASLRNDLGVIVGGRENYYRVNFFRENDEIRYFIICRDLDQKFCDYPSVHLGIATTKLTEGLRPSFLKTGNYLESHLQLREARKSGFDEILYLDQEDQIAECSTSNLFFVKEGIIHTPKLRSYILDGICRKNVLKIANEKKWEIIEGAFKQKDLASADEVWMTNSVKGLIAVNKFRDSEYKKSEFFDRMKSYLYEYKDQS